MSTKLIERYRGYLNTDALFASIIRVIDEIRDSGDDPQATKWENQTLAKAQMLRLVHKAYRELAEYPDRKVEPWPFTSDFVVRAWERYRKLTRAQKAQVRDALSIPSVLVDIA